MAGTDKFAYDGLCEEDNGNLSVIDIYKRESNGLLTYIGQDNQTPAGENGKQYCAGILAATLRTIWPWLCSASTGRAGRWSFERPYFSDHLHRELQWQPFHQEYLGKHAGSAGG